LQTNGHTLVRPFAEPGELRLRAAAADTWPNRDRRSAKWIAALELANGIQTGGMIGSCSDAPLFFRRHHRLPALTDSKVLKGIRS
jgi:hypothetical protein